MRKTVEKPGGVTQICGPHIDKYCYQGDQIYAESCTGVPRQGTIIPVLSQYWNHGRKYGLVFDVYVFVLVLLPVGMPLTLHRI